MIRFFKKKAHSEVSRIKPKMSAKKLKTMKNNFNYLRKAAQSLSGIDYDELLLLQTETGLSIKQLEYMYYHFKN